MGLKGLITDIQRFSLHDGPGIRTTVFFKGCNLNCAWCHNPETINPKPELLYYESQCLGCLHCIPVCPAGAQRAVDGQHRFERDRCIACGRCAAVCYPGAAVLAGREVSAQAVLEEILQDRAYYQRSGGGVTLSGGEVLVQKDFAREILALCREQGVPTAIETNLCATWEDLQTVLPLTDLLLLDVKHWDAAEHRRWTGADNRLIHENLRHLAQVQVPLIIRTPVIPGVNDSEPVIARIAECLAGLPNLLYYELLRFNPLGENKYRALGRENPFQGAAWLPEATMECLARAAEGYGIRVKRD
ncbi:glycyl-radical enzyme activating protein [Hydrogenispora ethanolica]|uniref:glycyl-radical enzyme activating protein n=1 Tax=Hydrogenispora ethanolica TaxID=1082276 RepID=UPI001FB3FEF3|nr:glycyl-radical enzyme activating protein [Hydrogenispora ethanolica]